MLPPLSRQGRFQGFSPADVLYLIMPDRFSDGDPANNEPPQSRGIYDRRTSSTITVVTCRASSIACLISKILV